MTGQSHGEPVIFSSKCRLRYFKYIEFTKTDHTIRKYVKLPNYWCKYARIWSNINEVKSNKMCDNGGFSTTEREVKFGSKARNIS